MGPRRSPTDPLDDRHRDIARSAQAMYEEAFFHLLRILQERSGLADLALAGGCAMNSVANGKVRRMTPFRRVYVQSAAGDAGGAIGAAFAVWHKLGGKRNFVMDHAYWGPAFGAPEIAQIIAQYRSQISADGCTVDEIFDEATLCRRTAGAIAEGQGRRLVSGPNGMGAASTWQSLNTMRSAPCRYEGVAECQDQASRIVSAVRALGARRSRVGMV